MSRYLINRALDHHTGTIVFNRNIGWKQKVKLGRKGKTRRRNNQNFVLRLTSFVQLPHYKIIEKTRYKGEEVGIEVLDQKEDHTSKCSFPGNESIGHHDVYMGKRVKRGLFKCSVGVDISKWVGCKKKRIFDTINADVQGAYNGLRNVDPRFSVLDVMEGVAVHGLVPERLSVSDLMTKSYEQLKLSKNLS